MKYTCEKCGKKCGIVYLYRYLKMWLCKECYAEQETL